MQGSILAYSDPKKPALCNFFLISCFYVLCKVNKKFEKKPTLIEIRTIQIRTKQGINVFLINTCLRPIGKT